MRWMCVVFVLAACDSGAPSCEQAVDKAFAATGGIGSTPDDVQVRSSLIAMCEGQRWSQDVKTCLVKATDGTSADACFAKLSRNDREGVVVTLGARTAELRAAMAQLEAERARKVLEDLVAQMDALDTRVAAAIDAVVRAESDDERSRAQQQLAAVRKEKADLETKLAAAKAAADRAERMRGVHISQECIDNPLAKGCQ